MRACILLLIKSIRLPQLQLHFMSMDAHEKDTTSPQQIWLFPELPDVALQALAADTLCTSQRHCINKLSL